MTKIVVFITFSSNSITFHAHSPLHNSAAEASNGVKHNEILKENKTVLPFLMIKIVFLRKFLLWNYHKEYGIISRLLLHPVIYTLAWTSIQSIKDKKHEIA